MTPSGPRDSCRVHREPSRRGRCAGVALTVLAWTRGCGARRLAACRGKAPRHAPPARTGRHSRPGPPSRRPAGQVARPELRDRSGDGAHGSCGSLTCRPTMWSSRWAPASARSPSPCSPSARKVVAVEVDRALAGALAETVAATAPQFAGRLEVVNADAARMRASRWASDPLSLSRTCPTTSRFLSCCTCSPPCRHWPAAWSWCRPRWPTGCARSQEAPRMGSHR